MMKNWFCRVIRLQVEFMTIAKDVWKMMVFFLALRNDAT